MKIKNVEKDEGKITISLESKTSKVFLKFVIDISIINTMDNKIISAVTLLEGTGVSILDAARLICNILDALPKASSYSPVRFCSKVVETGKRYIRSTEMNFLDGFEIYLKSKLYLRPDSLRDIRYLKQRLSRSNPELAGRNFSDISRSECEEWLNTTFKTSPQFNKGRSFLHSIFEFAVKREWVSTNPLKLIEKRKVIEREIKPLSLLDTKRLIDSAKKYGNSNCIAAAAILIYAGIRPREIRRLKWRDIDIEENTITIRPECSKTGGSRQVEICNSLKTFLSGHIFPPESSVCPKNWSRRWKKIRDFAGFKNTWVQDVLRHTYASYHVKRFHDLPRLQINMGHRDISLLRSRYVNMIGITLYDAKLFFQ